MDNPKALLRWADGDCHNSIILAKVLNGIFISGCGWLHLVHIDSKHQIHVDEYVQNVEYFMFDCSLVQGNHDGK